MNKTHFSASLEEIQSHHSTELAELAERRVKEIQEIKELQVKRTEGVEEEMKRLRGDLEVGSVTVTMIYVLSSFSAPIVLHCRSLSFPFPHCDIVKFSSSSHSLAEARLRI